jgi:RNA polymerase sigma factor (sigma-70 family)
MAAINNAVSRLRPLARDVLRTRYLDERRLSTMATELGVSQQRISQVHREALARIRAEIGASDAA